MDYCFPEYFLVVYDLQKKDGCWQTHQSRPPPVMDDCSAPATALLRAGYLFTLSSCGSRAFVLLELVAFPRHTFRDV